MSEEEIIDMLKNSISDYVIGSYCKECIDFPICEERDEDCPYILAIDGIIDLYNKQKERIKELEEEKEKYKDAFKKRMEYSHELEKDLFENCNNYVIHKDKIKEKIEELEERNKFFNKIGNDQLNYHSEKLAIHTLQELLK